MLSQKEINERFFSVFSDAELKNLPGILGVGASAVSNWRSGSERIPWRRLQYAIDYKNVTWDYLLEGRGGPANPARNTAVFPVEPGPLGGINDEKGDMSYTVLVDALNDHITTLKRHNAKLEEKVESLESEAASLREENTRLLTLSSAKATRQAGSA